MGGFFGGSSGGGGGGQFFVAGYDSVSGLIDFSVDMASLAVATIFQITAIGHLFNNSGGPLQCGIVIGGTSGNIFVNDNTEYSVSFLGGGTVLANNKIEWSFDMHINNVHIGNVTNPFDANFGGNATNDSNNPLTITLTPQVVIPCSRGSLFVVTN